ncbi:MAG: hypothetical protein Q7S00_00115, partial [bacterium]|nr:hypothetical protein [bacterium]
MIQRFLIFSVSLVFFFSLSSWAQTTGTDFLAQSTKNNLTSRKGFYLSGIGFMGSEVLEADGFSVGAGMRMGGGITEDLLLYVEGQGAVVEQSALSNLLFFDG